MVFVIATIDAVPGKRNELLRQMWQIVPLVRQEKGCLQYTPAVNLPTTLQAQQPVGEETVVVVESWESLADLEAHLVAPHMIQYRQRVKPLVQSVTLQILQPAPQGELDQRGAEA